MHGARFAWAILTLAGAGCASSSPEIQTAAELSDEPRRAPAVAVDPAPGLPPATGSANSTRSMIVLTTPVASEAARDLVRTFFRAVLHEASEQLDQLIGDQAFIQTGSRSSRQSARAFWRTRLVRLDYAALAGQPVYRESEIEIYRAGDAELLASRRDLKLRVAGDDVLVRVPVAQTRSGRVRVFGEEMLLLLRPHKSGYRIAEMAEDFQMP
jgi:hypothetical protein